MIFLLFSSFYEKNHKNSFDRMFLNYQSRQIYNTDSNQGVSNWLGFLGILSTVFAVFFVYAGFKIDSTKDKVDEAEKRVLSLERKIQEEIYEYARQLEYCMSFIVQRQYDKAIDALTVLRSEVVVLKDDRKINTCCFWLAHCYYERGMKQSAMEDKKADIALAVEYINQAFDAPDQPFKKEIIDEFNKLDKS